MALHYGSDRTRSMLRWADDERPVSVQLFGSDPQAMGEAAAAVDALHPDLIDINMGCWVPKVCRTGSGAALLRDPDLAVAVTRAVLNATQCPVTVKMRLGWDHQTRNGLDLALRLQDEGIAAVCLHARTARQGFDGAADWDELERYVRALSIPVIGNGDIRSGPDAERMFRQTGCAAVMVGRAAQSNPWIFEQINAWLYERRTASAPGVDACCAMAAEHLLAMANEYGEWSACRQMRAHLPGYIHGVPDAARWRHALSRIESIHEAMHVLKSICNHSTDREP